MQKLKKIQSNTKNYKSDYLQLPIITGKVEKGAKGSKTIQHLK